MDTDNDLLRVALGSNAAFSLATGLLLTTMPGTVGGWLGVDIDSWLRLLGIALLAHAAALAFVVRQTDPAPLAKLNVALIAPYPLLMVAVVVTGLVERGVGQGLVLVDGAVVGLIALAQARGLKPTRLSTTPQLG